LISQFGPKIYLKIIKLALSVRYSSYHAFMWKLYTFFFLKEQFYKNTRLRFAQNLRTIPTSAEERSLKFLIKEQTLAVNVVFKITASATQLANCILLHAYLHAAVATNCIHSQNKQTNKNFIILCNELA